MEKTTHTHELRHHNYRKGVNHSELIAKGTKFDCEKVLAEIALKNGVGASSLTSNGGYTLVDLYEERKRKIELEAIAVFNETGKTPRQLELERDGFKAIVEGDNKLIEILKHKANTLLNALDEARKFLSLHGMFTQGRYEGSANLRDKIEEAIKAGDVSHQRDCEASINTELLEVLIEAKNIFGRGFEPKEGAKDTIGSKLWVKMDNIIKKAKGERQ